jgi:hypothetical protein
MDVNLNCVDVHFDLSVAALRSSDTREFHERHRMRYLFMPELRRLLAGAGFAQVEAQQWMTGRALDDTTWYACVVARAAL